jgi:hypothetical protein
MAEQPVSIVELLVSSAADPHRERPPFVVNGTLVRALPPEIYEMILSWAWSPELHQTLCSLSKRCLVVLHSPRFLKGLCANSLSPWRMWQAAAVKKPRTIPLACVWMKVRRSVPTDLDALAVERYLGDGTSLRAPMPPITDNPLTALQGLTLLRMRHLSSTPTQRGAEAHEDQPLWALIALSKRLSGLWPASVIGMRGLGSLALATVAELSVDYDDLSLKDTLVHGLVTASVLGVSALSERDKELLVAALYVPVRLIHIRNDDERDYAVLEMVKIVWAALPTSRVHLLCSPRGVKILGWLASLCLTTAKEDGDVPLRALAAMSRGRSYSGDGCAERMELDEHKAPGIAEVRVVRKTLAEAICASRYVPTVISAQLLLAAVLAERQEDLPEDPSREPSSNDLSPLGPYLHFLGTTRLVALGISDKVRGRLPASWLSAVDAAEHLMDMCPIYTLRCIRHPLWKAEMCTQAMSLLLERHKGWSPAANGKACGYANLHAAAKALLATAATRTITLSSSAEKPIEGSALLLVWLAAYGPSLCVSAESILACARMSTERLCHTLMYAKVEPEALGSTLARGGDVELACTAVARCLWARRGGDLIHSCPHKDGATPRQHRLWRVLARLVRLAPWKKRTIPTSVTETLVCKECCERARELVC